MERLKEKLRDWPGKRTLMVIFPHPDDESMAVGGLLYVAAKLGWKTVVVTLTKGEAGRIFINPNGLSLKQIRESELKKATKILKVNELFIGDFPDGRLRENEEVWIKWLDKLIEKYRPGMVVTYDHLGYTGHPDHIASSVAVKNILKKVSFPVELFWVNSPKSPATDYLSLGLAIRYKKWQAAKAHKSQKLGKIGFLLSIYMLLKNKEWYHQVKRGKFYPYKYVSYKI